MPAGCRRTASVLLLLLLGGMGAAWALDRSRVDAAGADEVGRALYLEGRRPDGTPLLARRSGGVAVSGAQAACVNCHRRSGLGGTEGLSHVPPVTGDALLQSQPPGKGPSATGRGRPAYTRAALLRALQEGVDPAGRTLHYLMPRYDLDDREVRGLLRYLGALPIDRFRPDENGSLHFATVFTPDVPAGSRRAIRDVLQACFGEHNAGRAPERGRRKLAADMSLRRPLPWELHVWDLQGPRSTWDAQLADHARGQPVLALVGGAGAGHWAPVHGYCERTGLPCLFPHVELPVDSPAAFSALYLSKGALLEAGLIARHLAPARPEGRVVQVLRESDDTARAAARALDRLLESDRVAHETLVLGRGPASPGPLLPQMSERDSLVLWLRPEDLADLKAEPAPAARVFVSATLAARDAVPLPPGWKARALMAYPFELPEVRSAAMERIKGWMRGKGLVPQDERAEGDAYLACTALRMGMQDSESHPGRDYLLEKIESNIERWPVLGLYPRPTLGPGQRFASKTGYIVRFDAETGQWVPVGERSAP